MQQLIKNIEQWAEDRNLINGSTPQKQMLKQVNIAVFLAYYTI
ncbi:hypothetical protein P2M41_11045 [Mannheimia haemolytica]|nr:hypothetical protein [Mannheimia haemolytica]